jgi:hypothetical protein
VIECSELLKDALDILRQFRAAPQLQADIHAAHEVRPRRFPYAWPVHTTVFKTLQDLSKKAVTSGCAWVQELQAQVVLQLLALDLNATERARALEGLPRVLWQDGAAVERFPRLNMDRAAYLEQLQKHLTAAEQVPSHMNGPHPFAFPFLSCTAFACSTTSAFSREQWSNTCCDG